MQIGFIGLGNMGAPMARNLVAAGHAVTGFDVAGVQIEGAASAATAAEAATGRDAVITMLPNGAILRAVYAEIVPAGAPGGHEVARHGRAHVAQSDEADLHCGPPKA